MNFSSTSLKVSLTFVLLTSALTMSTVSNGSLLKMNQVAEAAAGSCSTAKPNGYEKVSFSKNKIRVGGAVAGGYPGALLAGSSAYVSSGNPITVRMYSVYCTKNNTKYLKQQFFIYNYANTKRLKGPYNRWVNMQSAGTGVKSQG